MGMSITDWVLVISLIVNIAQFIAILKYRKISHDLDREKILLDKRKLNAGPIKVYNKIIVELSTYVKRFRLFRKRQDSLSFKFPVLEKYKYYFNDDSDLIQYYSFLDGFKKQLVALIHNKAEYAHIMNAFIPKTEEIISLLQSKIKELEII